jgi:GxxExxY protein
MKARKDGTMGHEFEPLSGKIIEAALEVHSALGPGFLEGIYERAVAVALSTRGITYGTQRDIDIYFSGVKVGTHRLDLVVEEEIVVELKAVRELHEIMYAQVRSYLKATKLRVGLLLNFNAPVLEIKRIVM